MKPYSHKVLRVAMVFPSLHFASNEALVQSDFATYSMKSSDASDMRRKAMSEIVRVLRGIVSDFFGMWQGRARNSFYDAQETLPRPPPPSEKGSLIPPKSFPIFIVSLIFLIFNG